MSKNLKKCSKCLKILDLSNFYKHDQNTDGYFGKCKNCVSEDRKVFRMNNLIKIREYEKIQARNKRKLEERLSKLK